MSVNAAILGISAGMAKDFFVFLHLFAFRPKQGRSPALAVGNGACRVGRKGGGSRFPPARK